MKRATPSPGRNPASCHSRASWIERRSSSAKVTTSSVPAITSAGLSGETWAQCPGYMAGDRTRRPLRNPGVRGCPPRKLPRDEAAAGAHRRGPLDPDPLPPLPRGQLAPQGEVARVFEVGDDPPGADQLGVEGGQVPERDRDIDVVGQVPAGVVRHQEEAGQRPLADVVGGEAPVVAAGHPAVFGDGPQPVRHLRSEEHTSELQSRRDLVCRLLLEKKKKNIHNLYKLPVNIIQKEIIQMIQDFAYSYIYIQLILINYKLNVNLIEQRIISNKCCA